MDRQKVVTVGDRSFALSHPGKLLFPEIGTTKAGLVDYYRRVSGPMLPHLRARPLMLERHPDGVGGPQFMQKEASAYFPQWIDTARLAKQDGAVDYVVCDDEATLAYLAGQATITFHTWLSRADRPDVPDRIIFDLDPSGGDFEPVRRTALDLQRRIEAIGLVPFVQTTGSRGLHVVAPLERGADFDRVRRFARAVAASSVAADPEVRTIEGSKVKRRGRLYIDVMRNAYAQTSVAPYSVRALPGGPIATPLEWRELGNRRLHAQTYHLGNLRRRLARRADPWADMERHARRLAPAEEALDRLHRRPSQVSDS